jgi:thiol-disulfide isomerase/thioredoxin
MRPGTKTRLVVIGVPALAVLAWLAFPTAFVRGVVVGVLGLLGLIAVSVAVFARSMRRRLDERLKPPPLPVESWDYALEALDLAGAPVPFSRYAGRVLVLNFWATWCGPCLAEMPSLQRLQAATADLDVAFACLSPEKPDAVRGFVAKRGLSLPVFLYRGEAPAPFRGRAIPATFILDRAGRIVMRHIGAARWDDPGVVAFVRGLAANPA